jgi:predicted ribosome quality control (RQC) complex YloA/Tae2 family protein
MKTIVHRFSNINAAIEYKVGTNAQENTHILEQANMNDMWFHANEHSSCHVIAKMPSSSQILTKKQTMTIIKMGCMLCKQHTNKLKALKSVVMSYTTVKNIELCTQAGTVNTQNLKTLTV